MVNPKVKNQRDSAKVNSVLIVNKIYLDNDERYSHMFLHSLSRCWSNFLLLLLETFFCFDSHHEYSISCSFYRLNSKSWLVFLIWYSPEIDYLNAAQSGATSRELPEQVDYLVKYLGRDTPLANKWKLINVFIGFNDASLSCLRDRNVTEFKSNVQSSLKKLIENVDFAFINLGK
jgi:hypothetical protein